MLGRIWGETKARASAFARYVWAKRKTPNGVIPDPYTFGFLAAPSPMVSEDAVSVAEGKSLSSKHNLKARSRGRATGRRPVEACSMGETFEQAAMRELREETGILVDRVAPQV